MFLIRSNIEASTEAVNVNISVISVNAKQLCSNNEFKQKDANSHSNIVTGSKSCNVKHGDYYSYVLRTRKWVLNQMYRQVVGIYRVVGRYHPTRKVTLSSDQSFHHIIITST